MLNNNLTEILNLLDHWALLLDNVQGIQNIKYRYTNWILPYIQCNFPTKRVQVNTLPPPKFAHGCGPSWTLRECMMPCAPDYHFTKIVKVTFSKTNITQPMPITENEECRNILGWWLPLHKSILYNIHVTPLKKLILF